MTISKFVMRVELKYPRLLFWINCPLVILGFKPIIPKWMIKVEMI